SNILDHVKVLEELDTRDISPTFHVFPLKNVYRKDEVKEVLDREEVLKNAPDKENGFFKVPRIIE
ncbi:MAG: Asp-tRNA(Asn)/Glu-tRNA(Gln) amidotransferase GatCAB subunit C, partial [Firmicutes bacterium HGW-Firmicutes-13]